MKYEVIPVTTGRCGCSGRTRLAALLAWVALTPALLLAADIPVSSGQDTTPSVGDPAYGVPRNADGAEHRAAAQSREQNTWKPPTTADPLETYLARWMDPQDYTILVKGRTPGIGDKSRARGEEGRQTAGEGFDGVAFPITAAGLPKAGVRLDPANNPYLKAMTADAARAKPAVVETPPAQPPPTLKPPEAPAPKKTNVPAPVFGHPLRDTKEFPQLKRF